MEVAPLYRSFELGYVPAPKLVWTGGEQLWLGIFDMGGLVASLPNLLIFLKDSIHRADRAQIDTFIEERGIDLLWGNVPEPLRMQHQQNLLLFNIREGALGLDRLFRWSWVVPALPEPV